MLYEFLTNNREGILALCKSKLLEVSEKRSSSEEMDVGLPLFYSELVEVLRVDDEDAGRIVAAAYQSQSAQRRGKESLRLGYTISQVVHGYGALCQSITEYAGRQNEHISAREFNRLNMCLDVAIAEAVTEFSSCQKESTSRDEIQRLGFLAHEMRNALSNIAMAYQMIKIGVVGVAGSTNMVLEASIVRMKEVIDRSLAEVRMRGEPVIEAKRCRIIDLVGSVEVTSIFEANNKSIQLHIEVAKGLLVLADRHLLISAISNLVQNAIKFTKVNGHVWIRGFAREGSAIIEIEDQCGGLPSGKIEELFLPYVQKDKDRSGIGLGLAISKSAVRLSGGHITARDLPGSGCIFSIELPLISPLPGESEGTTIPLH